MIMDELGNKLHFFGMFEKMMLLNPQIKIRNIYSSPFNKAYAAMSDYYEGEFAFYLKNISLSGERILELCSGDGSRYSIPLLKEGFFVDGVELSKDMINIFVGSLNQLPLRCRKKSCVYNENVFDFNPKVKYDAVILPATSICLLADCNENLQKIFQVANRCLRKGGVFIFDYRIGPMNIGFSEAVDIDVNIDSTKTKVTYQEFWNYLPGWNTVNIYLEKNGNKYISSSDKKIFSQEMIYELFQKCGFAKKDSFLYNRHNLKIELIALIKNKDVADE